MPAGVEPNLTLRRGWTTGACATAAAKAAYQALLTGEFPDPVPLILPRGERPAFALAETYLGLDHAMAAVVKDAGDDPDVTHGALIRATVRLCGSGVSFKAGPGVGTVTRPGLPIPPGEPAINPMPRQMIAAAITETAAAFGGTGDAEIEISIPGGEVLAERTLNGRLGIVGGLSILGTTGVVVPYSCAAWIHSIHRGIDVARAAGLPHLAGATGSTSEAAARALLDLPEMAMIDMGDFVGGMLKYLRTHPVERVTVAGGLAKMTKLAQGRLDLHARRGVVDLEALSALCGDPALARLVRESNTAAEAFAHAASTGVPLADVIAGTAREVAAQALRPAATELEILVFDRSGTLLGRSGHAASPRNRLR